MPFVMPSVQVDVDASIGILLMRDRAPCNPLAYSIRPDPKNLCRLRHRVPLRPRCVLSRHDLRHALIMPAVLGILPLPWPFAPLRGRANRRVAYVTSGSQKAVQPPLELPCVKSCAPIGASSKHNQVNVGVYGAVLQGGTIRRGDSVRLE